MNNLQCLGGITNTLQYEATLNWFFNDISDLLHTNNRETKCVYELSDWNGVQFLMHKFYFYIIINNLDSLMFISLISSIKYKVFSVLSISLLHIMCKV